VSRISLHSGIGTTAPYVGKYFIFLHTARDIHPVKVHFRDHEIAIRGYKKKETVASRSESPWREKVFLNPAILQRKWIDYKLKDRFVTSASYDNVLPLEIDYQLLQCAGDEMRISLRSMDKPYRDIDVHIRNCEGVEVFNQFVKRLPVREEIILTCSIEKAGIYRIFFTSEDELYGAGALLVARNKITVVAGEPNDAYDEFLTRVEESGDEAQLFCSACGLPCVPLQPDIAEGFEHKNYIPVKEYLDIERLGMDRITHFIMGLEHPTSYKRGFIHLLNMLRLASLEDEITIIKNLFKDDPPFAHFVTDRLFLFGMIPIMEERALQNILNRIDDSLIASALRGQNRDLIEKVMGNVSRRRAAGIRQDMQYEPREYNGVHARMEMHRRIRSFFEERYGRELKIPVKSVLLYKPVPLHEHFSSRLSQRIHNHSGSYIFFHENDAFEITLSNSSLPDIHAQGNQCVPLDTETCMKEIFTVYGSTESTVYLRSSFGIRFASIHLYNWNDSLEDCERLENIGKGIVVPVSVSGSAVILTIGAIDARGLPCEQIIRLKTKGGTLP
jgi:hypothetical protein